MPPAKQYPWVMRLNHLALRLRSAYRAFLPFRLDPRRITTVALETTTECTRKCAYCPPHHAMAVPKLKMAPEIFRSILASLAAHDYAGSIFFSLYGESLADDRLEAWLAEARGKVPGARLVVFTNGDLLTVERYLSLKKAGMDVLSVSLHSREPGAALLRTLGTLQNEHPGLYCVGVIDYYSQYYDRGGGVGLLNNKGGMADVRRRPFSSCCDIDSSAIDCFGNVLLCNNDCTSSYVFGNVREKDFYAIWTDPAFVSARLKIMRGEWLFEICRKCMDRRGLTTPIPSGKAARLPPAFNDFREVLDKQAREAAAGKKK